MGYQALLFCPDEKAARGVTQVLSELDFTVEPCTEPFAAVKKLMAQHFDAIVVDCDNEQNATLLFKSARNSSSNQSSLAVAVVEGQAGVAKAFRIGANLVLTKPINIEQAKGTLRVARGLLRKGGEAAPKATAEPTGAPVGAPVSAHPAPVAAKPAASAPRPAQPAQAAPKPAAGKAWPNPTKSTAPARPQPGDDARSGSSPSMAESTPKVSSAPAVEAPSKTAKPAASAPPVAAPQTKYPWQASKPGAEPMASALKKAAEAAGIAAPSTSSAPQASSVEAPEMKPAASPMTLGSAAAPAPAKEKAATAAPVPPPAPAPSLHSGKAAVVEPTVSIPSHRPEPVEATFAEEAHAPSFSMGAPAVDEEEPANSKKAIIILAIVVVLASLAGYLGWKNMSGKAPAATPQIQAPPSAPAPSPASALPSTTDSTTAATAAPASGVTSPEPVPAQPAKPSAKVIAKDTTRPVAPVDSNDAGTQPSAPALVVHNETARAATKPNSGDSDSAPAPSALGLTSNPDPNALSAIGNAPVSVPKASNQVIKLSQGVSEGLILKKVSPRYPAQALQMHVEGSVQMQATISKDGSISNVKVISGDPLLAHSAQDAVKQWKYKPYYLDGEPVDIQTQITINFKLPR